MSTRLPSFTLAIFTSVLLTGTSVLADQLQKSSIVKIERPKAANSNEAQRQADLSGAIVLVPGQTTLVLRLSSTQAVSALSFVNAGTQGRVSVFASSVNLPISSNRWQQVTTSSLAEGLVKAAVRPNEARYLKVKFDVTQPGQLSQLGVYAVNTIASKHYALLAADTTNDVESDGKAVVDGKDLGDAKDIPSEGEAPAEGPPPGLPDPPPFTFVPVLTPTSP